MIKRIGLFLLMCLYIAPGFADGYKVDTVAMEEALNEIEAVGDGKNLDDARANLALFFYTNADKEIPIGDIVTKCIEFIDHNVSCVNFIRTYNKFLNYANFCFKANHFVAENNTPFVECYKLIDRKRYNKNGESITNPDEFGYTGESVVGSCVQWIDAAEKCSFYLNNFYQQKLNSSDLSEKERKKYQCLFEKVRTGNMTVPTTEMEKECGRL